MEAAFPDKGTPELKLKEDKKFNTNGMTAGTRKRKQHSRREGSSDLGDKTA